MRIEAFTEGRDPARPEANEDRFLVLPGRAYAAIDGVTSRLGTRYDGMLSGQYGAVLVRDALEARLGGGRPAPGDARALVAELTATIAAAYERHGTLERARRDPNHRFATTLALVLEHPSEIEILLVGDSGVRVDCARDIRLDKDLDRVTASLRQAAWRALARTCPDEARREMLARRVTWNGARQDPAALEGALDAAALAAIGAEAVALSLRAMPHLPRAEVERLVGGGILGAQGGFQTTRHRRSAIPASTASRWRWAASTTSACRAPGCPASSSTPTAISGPATASASTPGSAPSPRSSARTRTRSARMPA